MKQGGEATKSRIFHELDFDKPGKQIGYLRVPQSRTGSRVLKFANANCVSARSYGDPAQGASAQFEHTLQSYANAA